MIGPKANQEQQLTMKTKLVRVPFIALVTACFSLLFAACKPPSGAKTVTSTPITNSQVIVVTNPQSLPTPKNTHVAATASPQQTDRISIPNASASNQTEEAKALREGKLKADSVIITDGGLGEMAYGAFSASVSPTGGIRTPVVTGRIKVYIFRPIPVDYAPAKSLGVKTGGAYYWVAGRRLIYIRDVDLSHTDQQLCQEFGLITDNNWHFTDSPLWNPQ